MPTPFMHMQIAEWICAEAQVNNIALLNRLKEEWSNFYFGSIAPDYQAICDVPRIESHFYDIPPEPDNEGYNYMLTQFPALADSDALTKETAVFIAGYCVHLLYDIIWLRDIVFPFFVNTKELGDRPQRQLIHFSLLTYLDKLALESLPETSASTLSAAQNFNILPFAKPDHLQAWHNEVQPQLEPKGRNLTIDIYAKRLGMTPNEFASNLDDPNWMDEHIFGKLPVEKIQTILKTAVPRSLTLLNDYLKVNN